MLKIKPKPDKREKIAKLQKNLQNLLSKEKRGKIKRRTKIAISGIRRIERETQEEKENYNIR